MPKFNATLKTLPVNFCGVDCFVREWSAADRERWEELVLKNPEPYTSRAATVCVSLVDADGNKLCDANDIPELTQCPSGELIKVVLLANKLNAITHLMDDIEKN